MSSVSIVLSSWEIMVAAQAGMMRQIDNLQRRRQPAYGAPRAQDWQLNIEGALGEYALAKYLNVYWSGQGFRKSDVYNFEVRTSSRDNGDMILHPKDDDNKIFYLLCGMNGTYSLKGWIRAGDGKRPEFWKDPAGGRPAFFVPQSALMDPALEPARLDIYNP